MAKMKVKTGTVDPFPETIERKDVAVTISVRFEADLLDAIRARAEAEGKPYQSLMKQVLREKFLGEGAAGPDLSARVAELEKAIFHVKRDARVGGRSYAWTKTDGKSTARAASKAFAPPSGHAVKGKKRA